MVDVFVGFATDINLNLAVLNVNFVFKVNESPVTVGILLEWEEVTLFVSEKLGSSLNVLWKILMSIVKSIIHLEVVLEEILCEVDLLELDVQALDRGGETVKVVLELVHGVVDLGLVFIVELKLWYLDIRDVNLRNVDLRDLDVHI